jgi:putative transposase
VHPHFNVIEMRVLNKRKVKWIIKQMGLKELSVWQIAKQQKVTPRWVRYLYDKYLKTGKLPVPKKPGKPPKPLLKKEINLVKKMYKTNPCGAVNMEKLLPSNKKISHNRIHKIMKQEDLAVTHTKKSRKRKWIRYERKKSNSLWHTDWSKFKGKWLIAILDDASRFIVGYGLYNNATQQNSIEVLQQAIKNYGKPKALLSDNGTQFVSLKRTNCDKPKDNKFQQYLKEQNIKQIKTRIHHPQTNGKLERWWQTNNFLHQHFGTLKKAIKHYNEKRPHMSLNTINALITPMQAYHQKGGTQNGS